MDEDVAASPPVRDADGNALMSLEELKEGMFQSIRDNGTVELIRAQLRRRFIEKLQSDHELELSGGSFAESSDPSVFAGAPRRGQFSIVSVFSTMPLRNEDRASRRPMPRQLDMSGWGADSSSSRMQDRFRSEVTVSRDADDFNYSKTSEATNRFDAFRENNYRPQQFSTRDEPPRLHEGREPRSENGLDSFFSARSTIRGSSLDAPFTSTRDSRGGTTYRSDQGSYDNQRDDDDLSRGRNNRSFGRSEHDARSSSDRSTRSALHREGKHGRSDNGMTAPPGYSAAEHHSFRSSARSDTRSKFSSDKADSIRAAESPRINSPVRSSTHNEKETIRKAPKIRISSLASSSENQDEPPSPTNSETSISPSAPDSESDSFAQRIRNRYPKPSIPSVSSDRSEERSPQGVSPCSLVSTRSTPTRSESTKEIPAPRKSQLDLPKLGVQSAMSDLREDLYAFRKQMREVFIRVEDMVDVHRSFFKSDPSTGRPVFNAGLEQEAEQLATQAFTQLADLRKQFTKLAGDFQQSEQPSDQWSGRDRERRKTRASTTRTRTRTRTRTPTQPQRAQRVPSRRAASSHGSDDDGISVKGPAMSEDDGDSSDERTREQSPSIPVTRRSQVDSDDDAPPVTMPDSARSTTSTYVSSQLQSRWGESTAASDISARISRSRGRSPSIVSDASSLPDQCSRPSEHQTDATDSIFQDFDKRMEEIRCSLNAIASGKKPHRSISDNARIAAASPKIFTHGDSASPIRSTLREASRISTADLDDESNNISEINPPRGAREAELRQLLKELNQLNGDNDADD